MLCSPGRAIYVGLDKQKNKTKPKNKTNKKQTKQNKQKKKRTKTKYSEQECIYYIGRTVKSNLSYLKLKLYCAWNSDREGGVLSLSWCTSRTLDKDRGWGFDYFLWLSQHRFNKKYKRHDIVVVTTINSIFYNHGRF